MSAKEGADGLMCFKCVLGSSPLGYLLPIANKSARINTTFAFSN